LKKMERLGITEATATNMVLGKKIAPNVGAGSTTRSNVPLHPRRSIIPSPAEAGSHIIDPSPSVSGLPIVRNQSRFWCFAPSGLAENRGSLRSRGAAPGWYVPALQADSQPSPEGAKHAGPRRPAPKGRNIPAQGERSDALGKDDNPQTIPGAPKGRNIPAQGARGE
jgi:hypothetical protein